MGLRKIGAQKSDISCWLRVGRAEGEWGREGGARVYVYTTLGGEKDLRSGTTKRRRLSTWYQNTVGKSPIGP